LSETGKCALDTICEIPEHYSNVSVEKYCIMPDHIHMIICLNADTGSQIVGSMKRKASKRAG